VTPLPAAVIGQFADHDIWNEDEARAYALDPAPVETRTEPSFTLTRSGVCSAVASVARANDLPVPFFANLIWQESSFDTQSVSRAGAQGIAQFMPKTAAEVGLMNPFEPIQALHAAGRFLSQLRVQFGNLGLAAAAYNAGPGRVIDWMTKRKSLPGETRNYVLRITGRPADQWTKAEMHRNPETKLMPARAPCVEVAEAVAHQVKAVRVTRLMSELAHATTLAPPDEAGLEASAIPERRATALNAVRGALKSRHGRKTKLALGTSARTVTALAARPPAKSGTRPAATPTVNSSAETPLQIIARIIKTPPAAPRAAKTKLAEASARKADTPAAKAQKPAAPAAKAQKAVVAHARGTARRTRVASAP
jgi:hypothetical protein